MIFYCKKNKIKIRILALLLICSVLLSTAMCSEPVQSRERKIKAAFLYNFINFVQWPEKVMDDTDGPVVIGIVGKADATREFEAIAKKKIKNKKIVVQFIDLCDSVKKLKDTRTRKKWKASIESLKKCHVIFINDCKSISKEDASVILKEFEGLSILIVGERTGFLERGGIINFMTGKKVHFEINLHSATLKGLEIRSKLLKLAKRVIKEGKSGETKK